MSTMSYQQFLASKRRVVPSAGIDTSDLPSQLFDWQAAIVRWALRKGRAAIFADCGLGKSFMQVSWAHALHVRTLFLAPLCVAEQTVAEAAKLGITIAYARNEIEAAGQRLVITNYERLDDFDLSQYDAVVLDESSILKAFDGKTRTKLIAACRDVRYRLCCTATPSPNDIAELGNHAEFLGLCTQSEFLAEWFVHDNAGWRMKRHAVQPFYRWMASWAVAFRAPSDLGYDDTGFTLPALNIVDHVVDVGSVPGALFPEMAMKGISGRLAARKGSLEDRVEAVREVVSGGDGSSWLIWCGLNTEADLVTRTLPGAVNVQGSDSYAEKVGAVRSFMDGTTSTLVSKVRILGFGLNFQHCHQMAFVGLGDSYEQYYQAVRRCWRFGQRSPVQAHIIVSEAERAVLENVRRKEAAARDLSASLIAHMQDFEREELTA